jgi:putative ABC transport system permease protein
VILVYPLRNLRRRPIRSVLTVVGVALAIALSTMMFSIGAGIRHSTQTLLEEGNIDAYIIAEGGDLFIGTGYLEQGRYIASMMDDHPEVMHSMPVLYETVYLSKDKVPTDSENVTDVSAMGMVPNLIGDFKGTDITTPVHSHRLDRGELPTKEDTFHQDWNVRAPGSIDVEMNQNFTGELSVNRILAKKAGLTLGDEVYLSSTNDMVEPVKFKVVNITKPVPEYPWLKSATLHLSELQYIKNLRNDTVNRIFLDLASGAKPKELKGSFEKAYPITFISAEDVFEDIESVTVAFEGYSNMIIVITFIIATLFTSTILIISVRERMVELGALRAMGISTRSILKTVLAESFIITMLGLIIGLILGYIMAGALDIFIKTVETGLPHNAKFTLVTWQVLLQSTIIALLVGTFAGLLPAYWITRLNITVVLKGE